MSHSDDPSGRTSSTRRKAAVAVDSRPEKPAKKSKIRKVEVAEAMDTDFGVAMAVVPALRRPTDA